MGPIYDTMVRSTQAMPYDLLSRIGLRLTIPGEAYTDPLYIVNSDGVVTNTTASNLEGGIRNGDRVVSAKVTGDKQIQVQVSRGEQMLTLSLAARTYKAGDYRLQANPFATPEEKKRLEEALKLNEPLAIAYYLKEDLRQFWNQKSFAEAAHFLSDWCRRADASGIGVLKTMSKTLRGHRSRLLNWYIYPISSGPIEGINNKIGALQRRAYGYRNYEHFKQRLLALHHTRYCLKG